MSKPFTVNVNRFDPFKTFRFLVYIGATTTPAALVSKVTGLKDWQILQKNFEKLK